MIGTVLWLSGQPTEEQRVPASLRRRAIAARCRLTGEPKADVAPLVGRDDSHSLDDCTHQQRRFRAQLALYLLNTAQDWSYHLGYLDVDRMCLAWHALEKFLPYPEALVVTTNSPDELRQVLTDGRTNAAGGMPGLRYTDTDLPSFLHVPTGAILVVHTPYTPLHPSQLPAPGKDLGQLSLSPREREALAMLPNMTEDAEQLLAALLIRLPLTDPDKI
jgi:hypothetical protein